MALTLPVFRFRYDDGSESTATWLAGENTITQATPGQVVRLRVQIYSPSVGGQLATSTLQYRLNAGTWTNVAAANAIAPQTSTYFADLNPTTPRLSAPTSVIDYGWMKEDSATISAAQFRPNGYAEFEFCLLVKSGSVAVGTVVEFRMSDVTTTSWPVPTLNVTGALSKTVYPATLGATAAVGTASPWITDDSSQSLVTVYSYRFRSDNGNEADATWAAGGAQGVSVAAGGKIRLRVGLVPSFDNVLITTGAMVSPRPRLTYQLSDLVIHDVTSTSEVVRPTLSTYFAEDDVTSTQLPFGWSWPPSSFVSGRMDEVYGQIQTAVDLLYTNSPQAIDYTEVEFCIQVLSTVVPGTVINLGLRDDQYDMYRHYYGWIPITVAAIPQTRVFPETLDLTAAILDPRMDRTILPSVLNTTAAVLAPTPKVTIAPAVVNATAAVLAPTVKITVAPEVLTLTAANPTPTHNIDATNANVFPAVLDLTAASLAPNPAVTAAPDVFDAPAAMVAPTSLVVMTPPVFNLTAEWVGVGGWVKSPAVLDLTAAVLAPIPKVTFLASVLNLTAAQVSATVNPKRPAVLELGAEVLTPRIIVSYPPDEPYYPRYAEGN